MANIRSVSLYSYQEEFFFGRLTLEGMIAEAAKTGARGIEFLAEQYAPDEYADPSDLFINEWNEWMDKYGCEGTRNIEVGTRNIKLTTLDKGRQRLILARRKRDK